MADTTVKLITGVKITRDLINTYSFSSLASQEAFFTSKAVLSQTTSYQRKQRSIKLKGNVESFWNVNYIMFKNGVSGKWFYGFVTDLLFNGTDSFEVQFDIDVLQTYMFDWELKDSVIEREHVSNDTIGKHRLDENLNTGDYQTMAKLDVSELRDLTYVIATTKDIDGVGVYGEEYTGLYSGLKFYGGDSSFMTLFLANIPDTTAVKSIFTVPTELIQSIGLDGEINATSPVTIIKQYSKNYSSLNGYVPKNNKLFVYPYNFLQVSNNQGGVTNYKYENSEISSMDFRISGNVAPNPVVTMTPVSYNTAGTIFDDTIRLSDFPLCSWQDDIYGNWLAQNQVSNSIGIAGGILGLAGGVVTGNPLVIGGGVLALANTVGGFYEKSVLPNPISGSSSGGGNVAIDIQTFSVMSKVIKEEYATMIDSFFDRFGYKVNRLGTPNLTSRSKWNYIKTNQINVFGNIPNESMDKIRTAFNNGLTFWHDSDIGNYSRSNGIV